MPRRSVRTRDRLAKPDRERKPCPFRLFPDDRQALDQLVVFVKLDCLTFPLWDREDERASESSRVAFLARRLITQLHHPALFGHGGDLVGTKGLAPPDGG